MQRHSSQQTAPEKKRPGDKVKRLRKEAQGTPPGVERERLLRRASQAETAAHISEWLSSQGLKPPK
jgi:hypothetical protein